MNPKVYDSTGDDYIQFAPDAGDLRNNWDEFESYIKDVEQAVRGEPRYTEYIAKLKSAGLDKCSVLGNSRGKKLRVEMHHGPMFSLFDICRIVILHLMSTKQFVDMTSYDIADLVLDAHWRDDIQIVMLSKTPHKAVDTSEMFIHCKASFGRVDRFMDTYPKGIDDYVEKRVKEYIKMCKKYEGNIDNGLFETSTRVSVK